MRGVEFPDVTHALVSPPERGEKSRLEICIPGVSRAKMPSMEGESRPRTELPGVHPCEREPDRADHSEDLCRANRGCSSDLCGKSVQRRKKFLFVFALGTRDGPESAPGKDIYGVFAAVNADKAGDSPIWVKPECHRIWAIESGEGVCDSARRGVSHRCRDAYRLSGTAEGCVQEVHEILMRGRVCSLNPRWHRATSSAT